MIVVDAKDQILGRMAMRAAKLALQGENVRIINCEKAIVTGNPKSTMLRYRFFREELGSSPFKGPFFPKRADRIVKRTIRGMIPRKGERGRKALSRIKCYLKVPKELADKEVQFWDISSVAKLKTPKFMTVGDIASALGSRPVK